MPRGKHPNSLAALGPTKIKAGEVRNPLGINRKRPYSDRHNERAEDPIPEMIRLKLNRRAKTEVLKAGATWADGEVLNLHLRAALDSDVKPIQEITNRIEGKPPQRMEIVGTQRTEITVNVRFQPRTNPQLSE
jgi:hypothetical protein